MATVAKVKAPRPLEEAISMVGFGKFNLFVLLATGLCLMCVIIETMCAMFIIPAAQCDLNLDLTQKGILYSISFFGVVSSSHLWGYIADTRGRKNVLLVSLLSSAIVSFICSFVSLPWLFILLRYVNGFLIGGSSAIVYAFAGEFHDNIFRPKVVTWIATFVALGNMYLPGLAWVILPQDWSIELTFLNTLFRPWRLLVIIYALPSLISALLICFLPESPKYLLTQGKTAEEYNVSVILWDEAIGEVQHEERENMLKSMWKQTVPLFKKTFIVKTVMVCFLQFAIFLSTSAVVMWYPQVLNSMTDYGKVVPENEVTMCKSIFYEEDNGLLDDNFPKAIVSKTCHDTVNTEVFLVSLVIGAAYALCYIFIGSVINLVGKKNLLIGFITVTTTFGICAQLLNGYTYVQLGIGLFIMGASGIGIVNAVVVDLYPTQIRGMALAVSLMFGRFGAMTGSNIGGPLLYGFCDYMFYVLAADHLLVIIVVLLLPSTQQTHPKMKTNDLS